MKKLLHFLFIFIFCLPLFTTYCFAQAYGEGDYGSGDYNVGQILPTSTTSNPSSNNSNPPGPSVCNAAAPASSPDLFQIDVAYTTATLYFVPAKAPLTYYYISFGTNADSLEYGTQFNSFVYPGVQKVTINALKPNTKYYFKIRAGNDCMPGDWSKLLLARTTSSSKSPKRIYYSSTQKVPESVAVASIPSQIKSKPSVNKTTSVSTIAPTTIIEAPKATITAVPKVQPEAQSSAPTFWQSLKSRLLNLFKF